jgi:hypothetical protein
METVRHQMAASVEPFAAIDADSSPVPSGILAASCRPTHSADFKRTCPNCGTALFDRQCKSRCPRCHYFSDCSDPW